MAGKATGTNIHPPSETFRVVEGELLLFWLSFWLLKMSGDADPAMVIRKPDGSVQPALGKIFVSFFGSKTVLLELHQDVLWLVLCLQPYGRNPLVSK